MLCLLQTTPDRYLRTTGAHRVQSLPHIGNSHNVLEEPSNSDKDIGVADGPNRSHCAIKLSSVDDLWSFDITDLKV